MAGHDLAGTGILAGHGTAGHAMTEHGRIGQDRACQGEAGHGMGWQGRARHGGAGCGGAGRGWAWQGRASVSTQAELLLLF